MSVRLKERKQSKMEVQMKAAELVAYTIENVGKEKIVSKRNRWSLGNRLVDAALSLANHIDVANTMRLDVPMEAEERQLEQRRAIAATFSLMTLVHAAHKISRFDPGVMLNWAELVSEVQKMLNGWVDSDRKRKKELEKKGES